MHPKDHDLNSNQVQRFLKTAFAKGIYREVHWTGGECTILDMAKYLKMAHDIGFRKQAITSNGLLLNKFFDDFKQYNVERVNISIDTLNKKKYEQITGCSKLHQILRNTESLLMMGIKVKFNMVLMKENMSEIKDFISYTKKKNIVFKIHELWKFDDHQAYKQQFVDLSSIKYTITNQGYIPSKKIKVDIPTIKYFEKDNH